MGRHTQYTWKADIEMYLANTNTEDIGIQLKHI